MSSKESKYFNQKKCLNKITKLLGQYKSIGNTTTDNKEALVKLWVDSFEECIKESCETGKYELFGECLDG